VDYFIPSLLCLFICRDDFIFHLTDFGSFPPEFFTEVAGHDQNISKMVFLKRKLRWFSYFPILLFSRMSAEHMFFVLFWP
jgi:hypothetical protein